MEIHKEYCVTVSKSSGVDIQDSFPVAFQFLMKAYDKETIQRAAEWTEDGNLVAMANKEWPKDVE